MSSVTLAPVLAPQPALSGPDVDSQQLDSGAAGVGGGLSGMAARLGNAEMQARLNLGRSGSSGGDDTLSWPTRGFQDLDAEGSSGVAAAGPAGTSDPTTLETGLQTMVDASGIKAEVDLGTPQRGDAQHEDGKITIAPAAARERGAELLGHELAHAAQTQQNGAPQTGRPQTLAPGSKDAAEDEADGTLGRQIADRLEAGKPATDLRVQARPSATTQFSEPGTSEAVAEEEEYPTSVPGSTQDECNKVAFDAASMASSLTMIGTAIDAAATVLAVDVLDQLESITATDAMVVEIIKGVAEGLSTALLPLIGTMGSMAGANLATGLGGKVTEKVIGKIAGQLGKDGVTGSPAEILPADEFNIVKTLQEVRLAAMAELNAANQEVIARARETEDCSGLNELAAELAQAAQSPGLVTNMAQNMLAGYLTAMMNVKMNEPETLAGIEMPSPFPGHLNRDVLDLYGLKMVFINGQIQQIEMPGMASDVSQQLIAQMGYDMLARMPLTVAYQGGIYTLDNLLDGMGFAGEDTTLNMVVYLAEGRIVGGPGAFGAGQIGLGKESSYWQEQEAIKVSDQSPSDDSHHQENQQRDEEFADARQDAYSYDEATSQAGNDQIRVQFLDYFDRAIRSFLSRNGNASGTGTIASSGILETGRQAGTP